MDSACFFVPLVGIYLLYLIKYKEACQNLKGRVAYPQLNVRVFL